MRKRILSMLMVVAMLMSMIVVGVEAEPVSTNQLSAEEQQIVQTITKGYQMKFPDCLDGEGKAKCPVCNENVTWTAIGPNITKPSYIKGGHYYLAGDATLDHSDGYVIGTPSGVNCLSLNGFSITSTSKWGVWVNGGTLNLFGQGSVNGGRNNASYGASVHMASGTLNTYGVNITKGNASVYTIQMENGTANLYGGTVSADKTDGTKSVLVKGGTLSIYGTEIKGAVSKLDAATLVLGNETKITGSGLVLTAGQTVDASALSGAASIVVNGNGTFISENGAALQKYFTVANDGDTIVNVDGKLKYIPGILTTGTASFEGYCPVCDKAVTWYPSSTSNTFCSSQPNGTHFFLQQAWSRGITVATENYTDTNTTNNVCLHLNGKTVSSYVSAEAASGAAAETLTIMGNGIINGSSSWDWTVRVRNNKNTLNIYGGTYKAGKSGNTQGVVYNAGGTLNIYGGTFNGATSASATLYLNGGTTKMYGGTVNGATVSSNGGAVYNNANFDLYGGLISGGAATGNGGAVYAKNMQMHGGTIIGGSADGKGDALYVYNEAIITGGRIEGEVYNDSVLRLVGTPVITGIGVNTTNRINMAWPNGGMTGLQEGASVNVSTAVDKQICYNGGAEVSLPYVHSSQGLEVYYKSGSGLFTKAPPLSYTSGLNLDANNQAMCAVCNKSVTWTALTNNGNATLDLKNGDHYYLAGDVEYTGTTPFMNGPEYTNDQVCIHLNNHNITATQERVLHFLDKESQWMNGTVNFLGTGIVSGGKNADSNGATLQTYSDGKIKLYSGTFTKNASAENSAIVHVGAGKVWVYEDATIQGIATKRSSVLVASSSGYFYLEGGTLQGGNNTVGHGGNLRFSLGTIQLNSGTIKNGVAGAGAYGGNIYAQGGSLTIGSGVTVEGGHAEGYGGNLYVEAGTVEITAGAELKDGIAKNGGNLGIAQDQTVTSAGNITGGHATATTTGPNYDMWPAGNVMVNKATFNMTGGQISGGTADRNGQTEMNVTAGGATLNITGGEILGSTTPANGTVGTAIRAHSSTLKLGGSAKVYAPIENPATDDARYHGVIRLSEEESRIVIEEGWTGEAGVVFAGSKVYSYGDVVARGYCTGNFTGKLYSGEYANGSKPLILNNNVLIEEGKYQLQVATMEIDGEWYLSLEGALAATDFIKLNNDATITVDASIAGKTVDLNGHHVTLNGTGTLKFVDSTGDAFGYPVGSVINNTGSNLPDDVTAPNGNRYIAMIDGNRYTYHRIELKLTALSLDVRNGGLFYQASISAGAALSNATDEFGIAASIQELPGCDGSADEKYMVNTGKLGVGTAAASGYITGIVKNGDPENDNQADAATKIYANPYVLLEDGRTILAFDAENDRYVKSLQDLLNYYFNGEEGTRVFDALTEKQQDNLMKFVTDYKLSV